MWAAQTRGHFVSLKWTESLRWTHTLQQLKALSHCACGRLKQEGEIENPVCPSAFLIFLKISMTSRWPHYSCPFFLSMRLRFVCFHVCVCLLEVYSLFKLPLDCISFPRQQRALKVYEINSQCPVKCNATAKNSTLTKIVMSRFDRCCQMLWFAVVLNCPVICWWCF